MSDQLLGVLKIALLALLYLFFARVLWAVWSEVRGPRPGRRLVAPQDVAHGVDATMPAPEPVDRRRAKRARREAASRLVVLQPKERRGAVFPITQEITIGRAANCTIQILDDSYVSQLHARLFQRNALTWVEDLGSTNGTYLNGGRLDGIRQFDKGDRLQIGATVMEGQ